MDIEFKTTVLYTFRDAMLNQPFYESLPPGPDTIRILYDGTSKRSPARCFMVDVWMRDAIETWIFFMEFVLDPSNPSSTSVTPTLNLPSWNSLGTAF
jgi:hypothetical protein